MTRRQPTIKQCIQLVTIIALAAFFVVGHNIPAQALHKEEQALDKFNNLNKFADAAKNGKVNNLIEKKIPLVSLKATDLYKHADTQTKDCIDTAAKRGNGLATQEVVNCAQNPNFYNVNITNSTTATTPSITSTGASPNTGTVGTSTSDTTSTSSPNTDTTSTSSPNTGSFGTSTSSTSDNGKENNLVNDLVKTGKFTEDEAKDFVSKTMQSGDLGGLTSDTTSTSDTQKTANADTNTDTQKTANADTNTDTQKTANADTNTDTQKTANADTNTDTGNTPASDSTQPLNNQDNNQSSNTNSKHAVDYNDLNELVHNIKNHVVNSNNIALSDFQNSGAYKGADVQTQKCIDLAGKIGKNLGDQEIVHCSEDASFFHNLISNNNANNNNANNNNANNNNANNNNANTNNANNNNANTNNNANNNNANNNNNNADATSN
jgi:polyhydroxyalkanoate synthesis regulator phasin